MAISSASGEKYIHTHEHSYELVVPRNRAKAMKFRRKLFPKSDEGLKQAVALRDVMLQKVPEPTPRRKRKGMPGVYRAMDKKQYPYWFVYREVAGKKTKISFFELKYGPNARLMAEETRRALNAGEEPPVFEL